jgi:hypothetical protein
VLLFSELYTFLVAESCLCGAWAGIAGGDESPEPELIVAVGVVPLAELRVGRLLTGGIAGGGDVTNETPPNPLLTAVMSG